MKTTESREMLRWSAAVTKRGVDRGLHRFVVAMPSAMTAVRST
jgi:hypothetical protein